MLVYLDAEAVDAALSPVAAADAISAALRSGLDPAADPARQSVELEHGQLLLMPSASRSAVGVKLVTLAPGNQQRGLPTIQGSYVLFDHETLTPVASIDAAALTALRTPAVSMAAVRSVLAGRTSDPLDVVIFGAGPQGLGHARALRSTVGDEVRVTFVVRSPERAGAAARKVGAIVATADLSSERTRRADVIVCASSATTPLFDADAVTPGSVVIAVGSHEPAKRELPGELLGSAQLVVEDVATALRECGDVIMAIDEGHLEPADLVTMRELASGERRLDPDHTVVFKGSGMSWQDLVVAEAVVAAHRGP